MRIVVAPDKFAGSLTAAEAAGAVAGGLRDELPGADVLELPMADGGEGTLGALLAAGWTSRDIMVAGPLREPVQARLARRGRTAVVELAQCCGRSQLPAGVRAPLTATTRGVGEAILAAVRDGARDVVVAVGGSASTDGGLGMLAALGAVVRDAAGEPVTTPTGLVDAREVDTSLLARLDGVALTFACDVRAPLLGPSGAARLFGPQKGAGPDEVRVLEDAMSTWARVLAEHRGRTVADVPGAGAAGGIVAGALGVLGASGVTGAVTDVRVVAGAAFVADSVGLDDALDGAELVVVGEGRIDEQTLLGKAPVEVARRAVVRGARVVAVAGRLDLDASSMQDAGIGSVLTLSRLAGLDQDPVRDAAVLAELAGRTIARTVC